MPALFYSNTKLAHVKGIRLIDHILSFWHCRLHKKWRDMTGIWYVSFWLLCCHQWSLSLNCKRAYIYILNAQDELRALKFCFVQNYEFQKCHFELTHSLFSHIIQVRVQVYYTEKQSTVKCFRLFTNLSEV